MPKHTKKNEHVASIEKYRPERMQPGNKRVHLGFDVRFHRDSRLDDLISGLNVIMSLLSGMRDCYRMIG